MNEIERNLDKALHIAKARVPCSVVPGVYAGIYRSYPVVRGEFCVWFTDGTITTAGV